MQQRQLEHGLVYYQACLETLVDIMDYVRYISMDIIYLVEITRQHLQVQAVLFMQLQ